MDKLEPILRNKFWILFGLIFPMALWGYYSANGSLKQETQDREKAIEDAKSGVPSGTSANPRYAEGMKVVNAAEEKAAKAARLEIWEHQKALMVWPAAVQEYIPATYRGEIAEMSRTSFKYKGAYPAEVKSLYEYAEPVVADDVTVDWKQKVFIHPLVIPQARFPDLTMTSEMMWDAQEDLWYLRILLGAVRRANESADSVVSSVVRKIDQLRLVGGTGESTVASTASTSSGNTTGSGGLTDMGSGSSMMVGGASAAGIQKLTVAFDPAEEFGPEIEGGAASGMSSGSVPSSSEASSMSSSGAAVQIPRLRFIALDESKPYRERGFYMSVLVNETKIADFMLALTNSEWPIRIVRFQIGPNPYFSESQQSAGFAGGPMGSSSFPMGGGGAHGFGSSSSSMPMGSSMESVGLGTITAPTTLDPRLAQGKYAGALSHPDLVQLDVCGAITFFNPPPELGEAAESEESTEGSSPATGTADLTTPPDAGAAAAATDAATAEFGPAAGAAAAAPAADQSATGTAPATTDTSAPDGSAPAAAPATAPPATAPVPAENGSPPAGTP